MFTYAGGHEANNLRYGHPLKMLLYTVRRTMTMASRPRADELGAPAQARVRSPYQLQLAQSICPMPFASPTPFIRCADKRSTSLRIASSGVRRGSSIATRKDTERRSLRAGPVWRPRIRTSRWGREGRGFAFKI